MKEFRWDFPWVPWACYWNQINNLAATFRTVSSNFIYYFQWQFGCVIKSARTFEGLSCTIVESTITQWVLYCSVKSISMPIHTPSQNEIQCPNQCSFSVLLSVRPPFDDTNVYTSPGSPVAYVSNPPHCRSSSYFH